MNILVTGAAGFIGSSFIREALKKTYKIHVIDALTYAGHIENIEELVASKQISFTRGDICDSFFLNSLFINNEFSAVVNFAAESHVDNSISNPQKFIETNVFGTFQLLEASKKYWNTLAGDDKKNFRYLQVSTDEVYGTLGDSGKFHEALPYKPNSPYSASKAAGDHLVRAWYHTYGLPTLATNCSNNYGPRQFPEKLIPVMITNALQMKSLPVYGNGGNIRDWIHVEDHSRGVLLALERGIPGETYCFGGNSERNNLQVVQTICDLLDRTRPRSDKKSYRELIVFVKDRAGHDWRYAIDDTKAQKELGFEREYKDFEQGLSATLDWYLNNSNWIQKVISKKKA